MTSIHPFRINVPDETLDRIRTRVAEYPWHEMPDDGGWAYGTNLDYMKELCAYWLDEFDWRKHASVAIPGLMVASQRGQCLLSHVKDC